MEKQQIKTMKISYNLKREDLINYYFEIVINKLALDQVRDDLIKGGEFILTAQDILDELEEIPGPLVGQIKPVDSIDCRLVL